MNHIDQLVEQHIRESESHMKHIDELMAKAQEARKRNQHPAQPDLAQLEQNWLQPVLRQLQRSRLRRLRLDLVGAQGVKLTPPRAWRF